MSLYQSPKNYLQEAQGLANRIAQQLAAIPSMEKVYVRPRTWGAECWIIAQGSTQTERFEVYEQQWAIMEQEPNITFKFHLVERHDAELSELLTTEQMACSPISSRHNFMISREYQYA